jgi:hypothetical protein
VEPFGDGTIRLVNLGNARCLTDGTDDWGEIKPCASDGARQEWYLRASDGENGEPQLEIVSTVDANRCAIARPLKKTGGEVWSIPCWSAVAPSFWRIGLRGGLAPGILDEVIAYAAHRCQGDGSVSCQWSEDEDRTQPAYQAGPTCVASRVVYNSDPKEPVSLTYEVGQMHGVEASISATLSILPYGIGPSFTATVGWVQEETEGTTLTFPGPAPALRPSGAAVPDAGARGHLDVYRRRSAVDHRGSGGRLRRLRRRRHAAGNHPERHIHLATTAGTLPLSRQPGRATRPDCHSRLVPRRRVAGSLSGGAATLGRAADPDAPPRPALQREATGGRRANSRV